MTPIDQYCRALMAWQRRWEQLLDASRDLVAISTDPELRTLSAKVRQSKLSVSDEQLKKLKAGEIAVFNPRNSS